MNVRLIVLLLVAVLAAGGAALVANSWLASQRAAIEAAKRKQPVVQENHKKVLVAKQALPAGTLIRKSHLRWQAWPDAGVSEAYMVEGQVKLEDLGGTVVRVGIAAGEPITEARVVRPGERGFLAAVLRPGFRAITVSVNATSGIAGFVFPGDRIDLILSHRIGGKGAKARSRRASETVLTEIRVLAIDQSTNDQNEEANPAKNVTLEVTPKQAEIVALLADMGRLSLSLRSLKSDEGTVTPPDELNMNPVLAQLVNGDKPERGRGHTLDSEVSRLLGTPRKKKNVRKVQVVRGQQSAILEFPR